MIRKILARLGFKKAKPVIRLQGGTADLGCVSISYLTWPFIEGLDEHKMRGHTNAYEVMEMARAFQELGFRVEICDWDNAEYNPPSDCRIAIDIHGNLERWDKVLPISCKRILHATGPHWLSYNRGELDRINAICERRKKALTPWRQVSPSKGVEIADLATVLGNEYTVGTFAFAGKPFVRIPISSAYELPWPENRNISEAKNRFLWVGSFGMVQKGLDLVLEAFANMPDLELTVCGRPEKEPDFYKLYEHELLKTPNIHLHGWVDMASPKFLDMARSHASIIYPGSGEGGAGSVIHCMHAGMVPICTRESSVDLEDFGIEIQSGDVGSVMDAVRAFVAMSDPEIESRARKAYDHVRRVHTRAAFSENYRNFASELTVGIP